MKEKSTFVGVARSYIASKQGVLKKNSIESYHNLIKKVKPYLTDLTIESLNTEEGLTELKERMASENKFSPTTIHNSISFVRMVVRYYYKYPIYESIGRSDELPPSCLSEEQVTQIIKFIEDDIDEKSVGIAIVLYTGMASCEITALKWEDIDLLNGYIYVSRKHTGAKSDVSRTAVVYDKISPRKIPITRALRRYLNNYLYNHSVYSKNFVANNSSSLVKRTYELYVQGVSDKINVPFTLGDLRDYFFEKSLKCGVAIPVLSEVTGVTIKHIVKRYADFITPSDNEISSQMEKLMY